jgi:hypothetical protein
MDEKLKFYLKNFHRSGVVPSVFLIGDIQNSMSFEFPPDYLDVVREFNGGEGPLGQKSYLILFPMEDLKAINEDYSYLLEDVPNLVLFGQDAADTGYAFSKTEGKYYAFGLMSNFETDPLEFCGNNFLEFIEYLVNVK